MKNKKILMLGDEAIGRGAIEAGISLASSYPGTPATETLEYIAGNFRGVVHWSVNEKIAYETALGVSYTGRRALCSMKHVGLNVASDPLMTSAYLGVDGGVVLAVADDPGAFSSQNEQDSRIYSKFSKLPMLEPCDSQEAKDMTIRAFVLSEKFGIPVLLRNVTRLAHTASPVELGVIRPEKPVRLRKDPASMIAVPSNVIRLHAMLNRKQKDIIKWGGESGYNVMERKKQKKGIIACGTAYNYAKEYGDDFAVLKISFYPVDEKLIREFVTGLSEVWVLEEGEPFVEELAGKYCPRTRGKLSGDIKLEGELGPGAIGGIPGGRACAGALAGLKIPPRPPILCRGCQYRELYTALKKAGPSITTGDIGCYTLGASAPFEALDTCLCMGAGISQAAGIASQGLRKVAAVIGDSTFVHAGIPALINAVYNKINMLVIILDNRTTAMTGHQPTPLSGITAKNESTVKVDLEQLCKSCGVSSVTVLDPYEKQTFDLVNKKLNSEGVNVIISSKPCLFVKQSL